MLSDLFTFIGVSIIIASTHPVVCQRWEVFEKAVMKSVAFYILLTLWFPYENWVVPLASALVALLLFAIRKLKVDEPTSCRVDDVGCKETGGDPYPKTPTGGVSNSE